MAINPADLGVVPASENPTPRLDFGDTGEVRRVLVGSRPPGGDDPAGEAPSRSTRSLAWRRIPIASWIALCFCERSGIMRACPS